MNDIEFFKDKDIAHLLSVSPQSIRVQRYNRRHGKDHYLTIDPVMIGSSPRYAWEDVAALIEELKHPELHA